ncbi:hypothetical protein RFI_09107, partial [Reticulomyxa filosa]
VKFIVYRLIEAVQYMHSRNIAHRDLKPENIVFQKDDPTQPICIDLGDAEYICEDKIYEEFVGTPPYMSPERLNNQCFGWELRKSDMWSIGVICYEMMVGKRCFDGPTQEDIFSNIIECKWQFPPSPTCTISDIGQDFIRVFVFFVCLFVKLIEVDTNVRFGPEEALAHLWFETVRRKIGVLTASAMGTVDTDTNPCSGTVPSLGELTGTVSQRRTPSLRGKGNRIDAIKILSKLSSNVASKSLKNVLIKLTYTFTIQKTLGMDNNNSHSERD